MTSSCSNRRKVRSSASSLGSGRTRAALVTLGTPSSLPLPDDRRYPLWTTRGSWYRTHPPARISYHDLQKLRGHRPAIVGSGQLGVELGGAAWAPVAAEDEAGGGRVADGQRAAFLGR